VVTFAEESDKIDHMMVLGASVRSRGHKCDVWLLVPRGIALYDDTTLFFSWQRPRNTSAGM
jgi:hypothetical protein